MIQKDWLRHAELDEERLVRLWTHIDWVKERVPEGTQWSEEVAKHHLAPTEISDILRVAFNHSSASSNRRLWTADSEHEASSAQSTNGHIVPHIWRAALKLFSRASQSEEKSLVLQRVTSVTRLVAFALMQVSTVAGEVAGEVVRASPAFTIHADIERTKSPHSHYAAIEMLGGGRTRHALGVGQCRTCPAGGVERLHYISCWVSSNSIFCCHR